MLPVPAGTTPRRSSGELPRRLLALVTALGPALAALPARAGPEAEVASAFDAGDDLDVHAWVDYEAEWRRAVIQRERSGAGGAGPDDPLPAVRDLTLRGSRHLVTPRLELGVARDVAFTLALPIVLRDRRRLELDDRGVDRTSSTTIADGILPPSGYDARDPMGPGFTVGPAIFQGVDRRGLDQVHVGLVVAALNQARDRTKPTWKIGLEGRIAVGGFARLDRDDPERRDGVGRGVHELRVWTSMARRTGWAEPHVELWWLGAIAEKSASPFARPDPAFGARSFGPMQRAGGRFGLDAIVWERRRSAQRVAVRGAATLEARFDGRDYSDMWEVFALAGDATAGGPLVLDRDPASAGVQAASHPGVSQVENYLTMTGEIGVEAHLGTRFRVAAHLRYADEQGHAISYADAGVDRKTCTGGATSACDDNDIVDPGTTEVNPYHVPLIDSVGHRYRVEDARTYGLGIEARFLF
jgi:hypothetical protein